MLIIFIKQRQDPGYFRSGVLKMQDFCNNIIDRIKQAENEKDLIQVINDSMWMLRRQRNSFNEAGYIMNMIVSLRSVSDEASSAAVINNTRLAAAIFRQLQREHQGNVF